MRQDDNTPRSTTSPRLLEAMLSHLADFAYLFDLEGRFVYANRPLLELLGLRLEEITGKNFHDLRYPDELAARLQQQIGQVIASGKPMRDETPFTGVSGETGHYEYLFTPVFDDSGAIQMVAGTTRNITARVEAEFRLNVALIAGEIGTWIFEIPQNRVYADKNLAALFGVSEKDANGGPLAAYLNAIHPDDLGRVTATIGKALLDGSEFESQYRLVTSKGVRSVLARGPVERDADGQAIRLPGVILDLTVQHHAEAELVKTQARLGMAIEAAELGTFSLSIPFTDITWNDKCREHFWISPDSRHRFDQIVELLHPDDRDRVYNALLEAVETGASFDNEHRTVSPKGDIRWVHAIGRCVRDAVGRPLRLDGITMDVTGRRLLEESRAAALAAEREARLEAERSNRFKDSFLATLSHELRTPLTPVLMSAMALQRDSRIPEEARKSLEMIERNISLEARLIDDMLDLTSVAQGKLHLRRNLCDAHSLIGQAIEIIRDDALAKRIALTRSFDAVRSGVVADPARFQQVIWNLLRNAVKFTPEGGSISVSTSDRGDDLLIEVADSGQGISPSVLAEIFSPFHQGELPQDHQFGGLGLGLAIARSIVDAHGGSLAARSEGSNRGSQFTVTWPDASAPPGSVDAQSRSGTSGHNSPATPSLRVLLVEDHADSRILLVQLLKADGHEVVSTASVSEALAAAGNSTFDMVISDLGLPDGTGNELMSVLRDKFSLKGIALSGYGMEEDHARSRQSGFVDHLTKPVNFSHLQSAVTSFAREHAPSPAAWSQTTSK